MVVYRYYETRFGEQLEQCSKLSWLVLDHLYGQKRFPAGGFIQNRKAIYEIARYEQFKVLSKRTVALTKALEDNAKEIQNVMDTEIRTVTL